MPSNVIARLYVGHESSIAGNTITHEGVQRAIDATRDSLTRFFGGCTAWAARGRFVGATGSYDEPCTVLETVLEDNKANRDCIRVIARRVAGLLSQECVLVTFQPVEAEFITAE
jgi:hypothetical protein